MRLYRQILLPYKDIELVQFLLFFCDFEFLRVFKAKTLKGGSCLHQIDVREGYMMNKEFPMYWAKKNK